MLFRRLRRYSPIPFWRTPLRVITIGREIEIGYGKHPNVKASKRLPLVPEYPVSTNDPPNMKLLLRYRDLKLRWRQHKRLGKYYLKRKRRLRHSSLPTPCPTCCFIFHKQMPHTHKLPELPTNAAAILSTPRYDIFAVVKTSIDKQHKVTPGDLVMTKAIPRKQAGDRIAFGTVLLVGTKDWTIIGKPTVPYARVLGTIEQQTITKDQLGMSYRKGSKWSRFTRTRRNVSIIHIDRIVLNFSGKPEAPVVKPVRLIDLFANRWLDPDEAQATRYKKDGKTPVVEDLFDGTEVRPYLYHNRGLTDCYRYSPDPLIPSPGLFAETCQSHNPRSTQSKNH